LDADRLEAAGADRYAPVALRYESNGFGSTRSRTHTYVGYTSPVLGTSPSRLNA